MSIRINLVLISKWNYSLLKFSEIYDLSIHFFQLVLFSVVVGVVGVCVSIVGIFWIFYLFLSTVKYFGTLMIFLFSHWRGFSRKNYCIKWVIDFFSCYASIWWSWLIYCVNYHCSVKVRMTCFFVNYFFLIQERTLGCSEVVMKYLYRTLDFRLCFGSEIFTKE